MPVPHASNRTTRSARRLTAQAALVLAGLLPLWTRSAAAQSPPIADRVETALLPSGITEFPVQLSGELVTFFKDPDGSDALHFIGDFRLTLGDEAGTEIAAAEAVIWILNRDYQKRPYLHLQIMLWRDAEVVETGGTRTSGPLLFVTISTFADVVTHADDVARTPFADPTQSELYQQGNAIRQAIASFAAGVSDADSPMRVLDPTMAGREPTGPEPRPVIYFQSPGKLTLENIGGRQVMVITGGVYMARGLPSGNRYLEIQADNAVVFFSEDQRAITPGGLPGSLPDAAPGQADQSQAAASRARPDQQLMATAFGEVEVEGAYLEGDIRMAQGPHSIRAGRLYYDFTDERAVILDAVARTVIESRGVPIYLRADEIRQLSANRFVANNAILTTSEFHTPHYHVGAQRIELTTQGGGMTGLTEGSVRGGTFDIRNATLNLQGHPIAFWPQLRGSLETSETAIRSIRTGYSGDFGVEFEVNWHLFNLLGFETPEGYDATLTAGFYSDRGPLLGLDVDYSRDRYFGTVFGFALADGGEDDLGREREDASEHDFRGRALIRHRHYLEDDWQVSFELSYISDTTFLEEFFETEYDTGKEQETLLYLKKQRDNWAFTTLLQTRILDFVTQTERFPDLGYFVIGESLGDRLTWFSENRAGFVRYRAGDQTFREVLRDGRERSSDTTARADSRQEIQTPIDLGPWRFVPFATARGTAWSDSIDDGGLGRGFGMVGVRGSMYLSRLYGDYKSDLLDIDGLRHVIKPEIVAWTSEANQDPEDLFQFDPTVEGIDPTDGVMFGVRQRWQTKRGPENDRRIVDVFTADVEVAVFNDSSTDVETNGYTSFTRPENSIANNHVHSSLIWRVNDRTAILSETNYDLDDGEMDVANLSVAVERTPRFSYLIGYRAIDETDSNLLGFDMNYRLTEKHTLALRELFDLERGRTLDFTIGFIRRFPRWFGALSFELDEAEDDFGVSVSIWPEGLPQAALGSRRFTGLSGSTRVGSE